MIKARERQIQAVAGAHTTVRQRYRRHIFGKQKPVQSAIGRERPAASPTIDGERVAASACRQIRRFDIRERVCAKAHQARVRKGEIEFA